MQAQRKDRRGGLIPVIATVIVAVVGQTLFSLTTSAEATIRSVAATRE